MPALDSRECRDNPFSVGTLGEGVIQVPRTAVRGLSIWGFTMRTTLVLAAGLLLALAFRPTNATDAAQPPAWAPKFKMQEIDTGLSIGYAVLTADLNGDGKPDILVVDQLKVVWYENPTWKKHIILDGKTKPDNVCAAVLDIDGDGKLDIVLGAGWKASDTSNPGTMQWLKNPGVVDKEWAMYPIPCDEPTVHRVRVADLDGDGKPEIIMVPLQGRDATQKGNYVDGRPVRIMSYKVPAKDPEKAESWKPIVLSEELHVVHNFDFTYQIYSKPTEVASILTASYEGLTALWIEGGKVTKHNRIGAGNQANPMSNRGSSEVRAGSYAPVKKGTDTTMAVTIEPWHGNQVVVYPSRLNEPIPRLVIDDHLRWGHAIRCADLDGDGRDEIVIGVRDNPAKGDTFTEKCGVRIYKNTDGKGEKWERFILDDGGIAAEDLTVADLDGDGKPDIIACGRATKNVRIFWNQGR